MLGSRPVVVVRMVQVLPDPIALAEPVCAGKALIPEISRFGPLIEDVDDRLPYLIRRGIHVRRIHKIKGLLSDTALHLLRTVQFQAIAASQ
jgi:hypothetical protein